MRSLPRLMLSYSRYHHRADGLATVKATRCAGGPRPTLTAAARRAFAERVGSEGNVAVVHQGKGPFGQSALSPFWSDTARRPRRYNWEDRVSREFVVGSSRR